MTDLAKLVVKLEAQTAQYMAQLDSANKKLDNFAKKSQSSLSAVKQAFGLISGALALGGFTAFIKGAIDSADHLNDLSKQTGLSTESLSKLQFAAGQSGATLEDVTTGIRKLNLAMSEAAGKNTSDAAIAFKSLGISLTDANGKAKDAEEIFKEVADKFAAYSDGANKNAIANILFGKSFTTLIPLLNEGRRGIDEMGAQAEKFGAVVDQDFADAADKFNDKLGEMKAELVEGLGNQVAANVLPAFLELSKAWDDDAGRADALRAVAGVLSGALKGLVTGGIIVTSIFQQLGQAIYSTNAAMYALAHGDYKQAWNELSSGYQSMVDNVSHDIEKIAKMWDAGPLGKENLDATAAAASKVRVGDGKVAAPNVTAAIEAQKKLEEAQKKAAAAAEAAQKKLGDMNSNLKEQVETFDLGDAAATKYRLTVGSLADDVKAAGEAGIKLRDSIIAQADALEKLKDQKAVMELNAQIDELLGHTTEAAIATFDLQNAMLKASLIKFGNEDGLARLETLKKLTVAQAEFNEAEQQRQDILTNLQRTEDQIQHSQEVGATNELTALEQLDEARKKAADQLDAIATKEKQIADASGNPALIRNAQASADAVAKLRDQTDLLAQKMRSTFEDIGSNALASFLDGTKSASDAVKSFIGDLEKSIADFVAKDLIRKFLNSALGTTGSGGTGGSTGWLSAIASFFGGSRDSGGMGQPGKAYAIGTGAQPEIFVPRSHGEFIPAGAGGGMVSVQQHFHFASPTDRHTQTQIGAKAAGGVANASRRNG